ncbi:MAG TPA: VOC family protein [Candidatus Dormibacteraeota bacterium]|nr:VOC family protein [Candidatus Dormibacteraeota bacterium]
MGLLERAVLETTIPVQDLERARSFYAEKLGLTPTSEGEIGLRFRLADGGRFRLFRSGGKASGTHTQMAMMVDDLVAVVTELRARGLQFEEYDSPGLKTTGGIADLGYARAAWFKDSEGNLIGIAEQVDGAAYAATG